MPALSCVPVLLLPPFTAVKAKKAKQSPGFGTRRFSRSGSRTRHAGRALADEPVVAIHLTIQWGTSRVGERVGGRERERRQRERKRERRKKEKTYY